MKYCEKKTFRKNMPEGKFDVTLISRGGGRGVKAIYRLKVGRSSKKKKQTTQTTPVSLRKTKQERVTKSS